MQHIVVTIRDIVNDSYFTPQYVKSLGGFLRQLSDEINSPQQNPNSVAETMSKHPEDFEVYRLGTWDDADAEYTPEKKTQVCVISSLKR